MHDAYPEDGGPDAHALLEGEDEAREGVAHEKERVEAGGDPVREAPHQHLLS